MRVACRRRGEMLGAIDTEVTKGKFYDVKSVDVVNNSVFYTIVGDDGIEIQRSAEYFSKPLTKGEIKWRQSFMSNAQKYRKGRLSRLLQA